MADDIHTMLAALRDDVGPTFDVREKVLKTLAELPARPSTDPVLNWLVAAAVLVATLVWAVALPDLMRTAEAASQSTYVGMIESLDVSSEYSVIR